MNLGSVSVSLSLLFPVLTLGVGDSQVSEERSSFRVFYFRRMGGGGGRGGVNLIHHLSGKRFLDAKKDVSG